MASVVSTVLAEKLELAFKDANDLAKLCIEITSDVRKGLIKLSALVEELGPFLTNKDVELRERGTVTLSSVLAQLPKDFIKESELNFIVTFYCDRLKDNHNVIPAVITGILAIVQMDHLPQDAPSRLFNVMFQHVACQSQLQWDRRKIYLIFETLLQSRADDLKAMGSDFVYGVISAIDGERDPRNLILLFNVLPQFIKGFSLDHLTEEMFEVVACYFPVDFNSSSVEGLNVSRDDLAKALEPCLCAIPEFAEYCIPLIIEKLDSSLKVAKLDSLALLCRGASTFGVEGIEQHVEELWPVLRKEVMPGADLEIKNAGLKTITELVKVLSKNSSTSQHFIDRIVTDTKSSLCDVQLSLFWPSERVLESVAKANAESCAQVLRVVVPLCLGQYSTKTLACDKVTLMETLNNFMAICASHEFTIKNVPELAWTDIPSLYLNELTTRDEELKTKAFIGLTIQKSSLNEVHRMMLYQRICSEIESGASKIKNVIHSCLVTFAKLYPNEILDIISTRLDISGDDADTAILVRRLEASTAIAKIAELGPTILPKIINIATLNDTEKSLAALSCLRRLVATRNNGFDIHFFLYKECNAIDKLVVPESGCSNQKLTLVSHVSRLIVRKLDKESQQAIVNRYVNILDEQISEHNVILLEGLLTPLRRNVCIKDVEALLGSLYDLAINSTNLDARRVSCKLISILVNKLDDNEYCEKILSCLKEKIVSTLESEDSSIEIKKAAAYLHTWLTKAVVTRGSWSSQQYLDYQINILTKDGVGYETATSFNILTDNTDDVLTEENFCNIKIFYKQRIFQNMIQQNSRFDGKTRQNYLMALTHLMEEVPNELLFMHLTEVVPFLIESLSLDNGQLILPTLIILKLLLETGNDIFSEQIQGFITRLLNLTTYKEMKVRIAALECLLNYAKYPPSVILPYKSDIVEKLIATLDDRKRLVRKVAVQTRTRWFLVGSPGEP